MLIFCLDDGPPQKYVHPSEQVVPEPKKYTGSAIPSRSFKILQAMTAAPDNCGEYELLFIRYRIHSMYFPYNPMHDHTCTNIGYNFNTNSIIFEY